MLPRRGLRYIILRIFLWFHYITFFAKSQALFILWLLGHTSDITHSIPLFYGNTLDLTELPIFTGYSAEFIALLRPFSDPERPKK